MSDTNDTGESDGAPFTFTDRTVLLGIDIGGTKIAAGLVDAATGEVLHFQRIPTNAHQGGEEVLERAIEMARTLVGEGLLKDIPLPVAIGVGAGGQIGRKVIGKGVVIFSQIDPDRFDADTKTYFRFTRWRQTRALSQLLANLGGSFQIDRRVFHPETPIQIREPQVTLAGPWQARLTLHRPTAATTEEAAVDPGVSSEAKALLAGGNEGWQTVQVPGAMENYGAAWAGTEGEAVFRKVIDVPAALRGKDLVLSLGSLDDYDETYFNGVRVGGLGAADKDPWGVSRLYPVPANLVKTSGNVITVRLWDRYGAGGFTGKPVDLVLKAAPAPVTNIIKPIKPMGFYHPDYRDDFDLGDEPYRYYNW